MQQQDRDEDDDDIEVMEQKPKRAAVDVINLDDDEDEDIKPAKQEPSSELQLPDIPLFDYEVCMEPLRTTGTKTCKKSQLPRRLLEKLSQVEERYYRRYNTIGGKSKGKGWSAAAQPACLQAKLEKESTDWHNGDSGTVACRVCVRRCMPCVKWTPTGMFLLPLHRDDREEVVADGEIVVGRWIRSRRSRSLSTM